MKQSKCKANLCQIQKVTNNNPYLVSLFVDQPSLEENFQPLALNFLLRHVQSILTDIKKFGALKHFSLGELQALYTWGCKVDKKINTSINMLSSFTCSWGAIENFLFYKKVEQDSQFEVHCALPCLGLLLDEVIKAVKDDGSIDIPMVPIVRGFIYEQQFFGEMKAQKMLTVKIESKLTSYSIHSVLEADKLETMTIGVLYHLRYTYPVVDGVGYFQNFGQNKKNISLVFVQVSLSPYKKHDTNVKESS